jgi:hypothetical protein
VRGPEGGAEGVRDAEGGAVGRPLRLPLESALREGVFVPVPLPVRERTAVAVPLAAIAVAEGHREGSGDALALREAGGEGDAETLRGAVGEPRGEADTEVNAVGEAEALQKRKVVWGGGRGERKLKRARLARA